MPAPSFDRRSLVLGGALAIAGVGAAACTNGSDSGSGGAKDLSDWGDVLAQFDLDPDFAHFAAFVLAPHPASVREAIEHHRAELDRDPTAAMSAEHEHDEAVRERAGEYLGVAPDEVALTDSTTAGLGLTYHGLRLDEGDHVLTTTHDFYSTHESLRLVADKTGAEVERIALHDDPAAASSDEIVSRLRAAVRPETRAVALTWVHSSTGVKLPVRAIADELAEINADRDPEQRAILCLDSVHGFGAEDAGPADLGCDVFITGTHKWLFGPRGTGLVWASADVADRIATVVPPFSAASFGNWINDEDEPEPFGYRATPGGYKSFEHRWAAAEAFAFHSEIGRDRVAARTRELATRLKDGLSEHQRIRLITPRDPELSAGIVCCDVTGKGPFEVVEQLRDSHQIHASVTPYREPYVRLGPSIVTTLEQVDAAVKALSEIA